MSSAPGPAGRAVDEVLSGGGDSGALMRSIDWSRTPLGPVAGWPSSLRLALRILMDTGFPMYIAWGPEFTQFYNDGYRPILGATKHPAAMGISTRETFREIWQIIGPMFEGVMRGTPVTVKDFLLPLDRNGFVEECYFTFSYSPIREETGDVGGVLVTCTETTERVLANRRLATLQELSAQTQTASSAQAAGETAIQVLAQNPADLPLALLYLLAPDGRRATLAAATGEGMLGAATSVEITGPAAWERLAASLPGDVLQLPIVRPGEAQPAGMLLAARSPRLAFDASYASFLGLVVGQIATSIASARALQEAKKRADALAELDRAKTTFFSNVSHEFRTPLTLMLGPIDDGLADERDRLGPAQRERLLLVRRNGLRLQKLVNTLLDFARIEAGRARASFVPTDLAALTADLVSGFDSAMHAAGLAFEVSCPPLPETVYVDPALWEKIVLNLVSNALKYTFEGGVRVGLRWLGEQVELSVADTGTGIAPEELPRIFERFHRVEGARGRSHEGTGIGLALVQELVKLHGGEVSVSSKIGKGTVFTVLLRTGARHLSGEQVAPAPPPAGEIRQSPLLIEAARWTAAEEPPPVPSALAAAGALSAPQPGAERILVADDNADMRAWLSRLLSPRWQVETAADGVQALAAARSHPPDLILSDVMMPGLDGLGLVRALRADPATSSIPIVLLSARAGEEATIEGLGSGADEYLFKPFSANELLARVKSQLGLSKLRREAERGARAHAEETNRLLRESQQATRAREETLAVVSHDLRSPLSAIGAAAALLSRKLRGGDGDKQVGTILRAASRMERLIRDLLDLASIDSGTLSISRARNAAADLVRETIEQFAAEAAARQLSLTAAVEEGLPELDVDRERLLQALGNLVQNAVKFTPAGGSVVVEACRAGRSLRLSVRDTGPGVDAAALPHIFERHWHSAQASREGHGLGLSIARGIVEAHGGTVSAESAPGSGSLFSFLLPLDVGAPVAAPARPGPPAPAPPTTDGRVYLQGGGELGALHRALDWSKTALGPVEGWPQSLRTSVSTMLGSPYPVIIFWGPERVLLYNDAFRPIFGAKHPATLGAPARLALAEAWELLGPLMDNVLETGVPLFIENRAVFFSRQEGGLSEEAYFTWSYNPTRDESGAIGGLFAIASETTSHVVGERRLKVLRELSIRTSLDRSVEEVYRSVGEVLAEATADIPFSLLYLAQGAQARLVCCSAVERGGPAAPTLLRLDEDPIWPIGEAAKSGREEILGRLDPRAGVLPSGPWQVPPTRAFVLPLQAGGEGGATAVLVAGVSPLRPLDDDYLGFLQVVGRQIGSSLASARAYEQEKLRAEKLAELDSAKTAFFSNVSHELRTPLTLILGPVEDALSRKDHGFPPGSLELVRRNTLRLYKTVNTLLDFSRMEAGRAQARFVPSDLSALTRDLVSSFESAAASTGLGLTLDCPPLPQQIHVDPELWEKIVLNLLSNAIKYTHRGQVSVRTRWQDSQAVLEVEDTGVGIPEDELPRVFERFYRVRSTEGRSHEGTGIGLSLVSELVKLHGGRIEAHSRPGQGSTFTVRLPAGTAHLPPASVGASPGVRAASRNADLFLLEAGRWTGGAPDPAAPNQPRLEHGAGEPEWPAEVTSARLLVVDDNADLRTYVSGILAERFADVALAADGEQALAAARRQRPDLILSDVMMPRLDGFGLVRALRGDPQLAAVPVILLSARAGEEAAIEGLMSGADDYLQKPFAGRELLARVRTQLAMVNLRREATRRDLRDEQLRRAVKLRDEFLTLASHELRTPLTSLGLWTERQLRVAAGQPRGEGQRSHLEIANMVRRQVKRLEELVETLLDVSTLSAGNLELHLEQADLADAVRDAAGQFEELAARAGCKLELSAEPIPGSMDRRRARQIARVLLSNAIKFGAGKPVEVRLAKADGGARLSITDRGPGISPEDQERIFQRFERAVSERSYGGLGLGLWIARQLAEAMGGTLRVESTPGEGATFIAELPISP